MKIAFSALRSTFISLSLFLSLLFTITLPIGGILTRVLMGSGIGAVTYGLMRGLESIFKKLSLRDFATLIVGLFIGLIFGKALHSITHAFFQATHLEQILQPQTQNLIGAILFLVGAYLGTVLTCSLSKEVTFPFGTKRKDLLVDATALCDPRILDLGSSALVDDGLIIPRYVINTLYRQAEGDDDDIRSKARSGIESLKKLQELPCLNLRIIETYGSNGEKLVELAREKKANILTSDLSAAPFSLCEEVRVVSLHTLSTALKPLMQTGESMKIKIQRLGKEPNQGVGYLEDGTMVVINGGGESLGETIDVKVLSVKHTSSGRMIFTNTTEEQKGNRAEV